MANVEAYNGQMFIRGVGAQQHHLMDLIFIYAKICSSIHNYTSGSVSITGNSYQNIKLL